jgi:hypothetical protein
MFHIAFDTTVTLALIAWVPAIPFLGWMSYHIHYKNKR